MWKISEAVMVEVETAVCEMMDHGSWRVESRERSGQKMKRCGLKRLMKTGSTRSYMAQKT
jgi:hypothetical protein